MKTKKKKIFIALDTNKISKAKKIIKLSKTNKLDIGYKVGLELFFSINNLIKLLLFTNTYNR